MAYGVDAAIREQNRLLTQGREGEDDGTDWLHSDAAQRASLAANESAHTRTVISKFGGVIKQGTAVAIPDQTWHGKDKPQYLTLHPDSFRNRSQPSHVVVSSGVSGYSGYKPHAPTWSVPHRRADRESPFLKPYLEANGEDLDKYPPQKPHAPDYRSLNRSAMPKRMPVPGYTGHVARTKDSTESFGTSHWRSSVPASRAAAAAAAKESAVKKGMMSR